MPIKNGYSTISNGTMAPITTCPPSPKSISNKRKATSIPASSTKASWIKMKSFSKNSGRPISRPLPSKNARIRNYIAKTFPPVSGNIYPKRKGSPLVHFNLVGTTPNAHNNTAQHSYHHKNWIQSCCSGFGLSRYARSIGVNSSSI